MLDGKAAVVTGGSTGIGKAIAAKFLQYGADVVIAARSEEASYITGANIPVDGGWTAH